MPASGPWADWQGRDADQAVAALYHAHYRSLAGIAVLLDGHSARAEEIVQEAFASMHRAWRRLRDGDDGDKALAHLRRAVVTGTRSRAAVSLDERDRLRALDAAAEPAAPGRAGPLLIAALSGLPARQREALVLTYYANWPAPEIAAAMGISGHALNVHVRLGIAALGASCDCLP